MISRRTSFRIRSESSPQNSPTKPGPVLGVPESQKILYAPTVGKNPVGLCVPLLGKPLSPGQKLLDCSLVGSPCVRVADRDRKNSKNFFRVDGPARVMMVGVAKDSRETTASSESDIHTTPPEPLQHTGTYSQVMSLYSNYLPKSRGAVALSDEELRQNRP